MSKILDRLSHPALRTATEITYQMATNYIGRIFAARFYHEVGATWFVTNPIGFNKIVRTSLTIDTPKSIIDKTLRRIAESADDGPMIWDVGPSIHSATLEECLHANGWFKSGEVRSMVLDLHALKAPTKSPTGLTIELVESEEAFKQHVDAMSVGFDFPEPMARYLSNIDYGRIFLHDPSVYYYVGRVHGNVVAISLVLLCEGIAGIYNIATIPQMRHQGFGTAMTLAALHQALDLGYHIAVLQASEMGAPIYRSIGFQDHFMFESYVLQKDAKK